MKRQPVRVQSYGRWRPIPLRHCRVRTRRRKQAQSQVIVQIQQRVVLRYQPNGDIGDVAECFLWFDASQFQRRAQPR